MRSLIVMLLMGYLCVIVSGCAAGRAFNSGEGYEQEGKYEEAMYSYAEALKSSPDTVEYRMRYLAARDKAANARYKKGIEKFEKGDFSSALIDFQTANILDPSQDRYKRMVEDAMKRRDAQDAFQEGVTFERGNKLKDALRMYSRAVELRPDQKEYKKAAGRVYKALYDKPDGFELNLKSVKPFAFRISGTGVKNAFRILTQLSGINFVFDEGVKDQPVSVNLEKASFQQVLDLLTSMNKLGRTILNDGTVVIYPKTPDKVKQYENMRIRTFHLEYMDAKKAINLIRSVLQVRKIHVNEETNSIVVRDTNDVISVIEKLLDANDVPDAEVLLDVEVVEVTDNNKREIGLTLSRYAADLAAFAPGSTTPMADTMKDVTTTSDSGSSTSTASISNLLKAFSINGYTGYVTVPTATYSFGKTLSRLEVLANPKMRVKNKEKAKFTVGDRVPITTTSTVSGVAGVSTNVQYIDVGIKLSAEPTIQLNNEVDIKLSVEVSNVVNKETAVDGTTLVTIGTRNLETVLSLKDGETSVIGGLIRKTDSDSKKKIYLIGDIPLIGPLLTGHTLENEKKELILAITPRLVRGVTIPPKNVYSFLSGREDEPQLDMLSTASEQDDEPKPYPVRQPPAPAPAPAPLPMPTAAGQPPATVQPVPVQPVPAQPVGPAAMPPPLEQPAVINQPGVPPMPAMPPDMPAPMPQDTPAAIMEGPAEITAQPPAASGGALRTTAPANATVGSVFSMNILADNMENISSASFVLSFDPQLIEPVSATAGTLLGRNSSFSRNIDQKGGSISFNLAVAPGSPGVTGSGVLATVAFRPRKKGQAVYVLRDAVFRTADGKPASMATFNIAVEVR